MSEEKRGSNGGKATALINQRIARERIDKYNQNPHICLYCGCGIIAPYDKPLKGTLIKKFCCRSCAAKYNNAHCENPRNAFGVSGNKLSIIDKITDEKIIDAFNNSKTIKEFKKKIGYKDNSSVTKTILNRLNSLGLNINDIKDMTIYNHIENYTKGELFSKYKHWQSARCGIQKLARMIYIKSDKPKKCIICQYEHHYDVAHIKSVSSFSDETLISEINDINNLIALCPNHHWEYDHGKLDISPFLEDLTI